MKKILKSLKWYFSHLNWLAVAVIFGLVMVVDFWENGHFNWILLGGISIFLLIAPLYGIMRSKWAEEDRLIRQKMKRRDTVDYLSDMSDTDRKELLKEVEEKTKGE